MKTLLVRTTERLVVRPLRDEDEHAWRQAWSTLEPARNVWDLAPRSLEELSREAFEELLEDHAARRMGDAHYDFGVFLREDGALLGRVGLNHLVRSITHGAFLGYSIFNRYWGLGYGSEAVRAAIEIAFVDLGLHRIEAGIEPRNRRSIRLARSLGMRLEGRKKLAVHVRGAWTDLLVYALTCEDLGYRWQGTMAPERR